MRYIRSERHASASVFRSKDSVRGAYVATPHFGRQCCARRRRLIWSEDRTASKTTCEVTVVTPPAPRQGRHWLHPGEPSRHRRDFRLREAFHETGHAWIVAAGPGA